MATQTGGTDTVKKTKAQQQQGNGRPGTRSGPLGAGRIDQAVVDRLLRRVTVGEGERKSITVHVPFTGEPLASVPSCTTDDVRTAAQLGRAAQKHWAKTPFDTRARIFLRFHDLLLDRQDEILDLIQLESGKARSHAFEEIADVAIVARYYATHGGDQLAPEKRRGALPGLTTAWVHHHPRGLIGFIAPWNYPLTLSITDAIPALLAGNAVLLKPDRQTPFTALWAADLLYEAGLPPDLFQIVTGKGSRLGEPLIASVDFVQFTGSTDTGRTIARQAGEHLIGCSLELGGKNPMLVLDDADVEQAARGAVTACFSNAGQLCISIERLYVSAKIYDRFVDRFVTHTRNLRLGPALDYDVDMGSIVSTGQLETIKDHVDDAVRQGAQVLAGGRPRPELGPLFYEPTILAGVGPGMKLYQEETFGPVVSVYRFDTEEEAIEQANATRYGLNASVWSRKVDHAHEVAARIEAGTVNINEGYAATWASIDAPMGGFKESGLGRRHGVEGILKCTESQTIAAQHLLPLSGPPGVPAGTYSKVMSAALRVWKRVPYLR